MAYRSPTRETIAKFIGVTEQLGRLLTYLPIAPTPLKPVPGVVCTVVYQTPLVFTPQDRVILKLARQEADGLNCLFKEPSPSVCGWERWQDLITLGLAQIRDALISLSAHFGWQGTGQEGEDLRPVPEELVGKLQGGAALLKEALRNQIPNERPEKLTSDFCLLSDFRVRWIGLPVKVERRLWDFFGAVLDANGEPLPWANMRAHGRNSPSKKTIQNDISNLNKVLLDIGIKDWTLGLRGSHIIRKPT
jgi:hypothetical protein